MYSVKQHKEFFERTKVILRSKPKKEDINSIRSLIKYHEWRYYVKNDPVISDFEYDSLFKSLEELEKDFPELIEEDSPTQRISSDLISDFNNVEHLTPMLSLDNSYNGEDLRKFDEQIHKLTGIEGPIVSHCILSRT